LHSVYNKLEITQMANIITINGVDYAPISPTGTRAVVVLDRGWIYAGDIVERDGRVYLSRVVWVFRWEKIGFDGVIEHPENAHLREHADINFPAAVELFRVPVHDNWGLK
jgi:hypothetical protein